MVVVGLYFEDTLLQTNVSENLSWDVDSFWVRGKGRKSGGKFTLTFLGEVGGGEGGVQIATLPLPRTFVR